MNVQQLEAPPPAQPPHSRKQCPLDLTLQYKQWVAFSSSATEMLYGGAAFGGKSHLMRVAAIHWCTEITGLNVYIFRRVEDDLIKNHMEGPYGFRSLLAPWVAAGLVRITELTIHFLKSNSKIFLAHCKDPKHRFKYHGAEIHVLMIDELTTFDEVIYRYLRFRTRMVGVKKDKEGNYLPTYPKKYRQGEVGPDGTVNAHDLFPRVLCGSNPGNVGHLWVKRTFIDPVSPLVKWKTPDIEGGLMRQYVPAKVKDNAIGTREDPDYIKRMRGLLDEQMVKAMEDGDWNILVGGYFPEFSKARHVIKQFTIPTHWKRFRATDWGSARPFSTGWYAIAQEEISVEGIEGNPITVQRGSLIKYREWYGKDPKQNNVGLSLPIESWAAGVLKRSKNDPNIEYDVVDGSMFDEDGGPSLAERAMKVRLGEQRLLCRPADKKRLPGWNQIRQRLQGDDPANGIDYATLFFFENCRDTVRLFESAQRDEDDVEDLDTDMEDHALDETRYGCMSRPRKRPDDWQQQQPAPPVKTGSFDWVIQQGWKAPPPGLSKRRLD